MLKRSMRNANMILQADNSQKDNAKEAKPVNDFVTDFLNNPDNKEANTQRLTMWYRLLAYENRIYRLLMILGVLQFDVNFNIIKNHQILETLKPFIMEKFDKEKIYDLKECFDRGLNSFFICLIKYGQFQVDGSEIHFIEGAPGQIISNNLDPFAGKNGNNKGNILQERKFPPETGGHGVGIPPNPDDSPVNILQERKFPPETGGHGVGIPPNPDDSPVDILQEAPLEPDQLSTSKKL